MKPRTTQIGVRFTPDELAEIDAVIDHPSGTGLDARTRSAVVRAALELYLGAYRATGAPPHIADAINAIAHRGKSPLALGKPERPPQPAPIAPARSGTSMPAPMLNEESGTRYTAPRRGSRPAPSAP
jgi:hypothetical protein